MNTPINTNIIKFCPICGNKLEFDNSKYRQCTNMKCGEVFYVTPINDDISITHIRTPFSPK